VLTNGSPDPALQAGYSDVTFGPQDPSLFTFTPPPGATVTAPPTGTKPAQTKPAQTVVGDGWDRVLVGTIPKQQGSTDLSALGTPVSGPWGKGRLITTAVATAIVTDDGRIAAGAVPEQVLTEALTK
jgi:hypothetical protein